MKVITCILFVSATLSVAAGQAQQRTQPVTSGTAQRIEAIARAAEPPRTATAEDRADLEKTISLLRAGKENDANSVWIRVAQRHAGKDRANWVNTESAALINYVLYRAYLEPNADLKARAAKVQATPAHEVTHVAQQPARPTTRAEGGELAVLELQNALSKQQKTYTALSNVMKTMSDTANSIIQNMK
jgi:hypothetical protein